MKWKQSEVNSDLLLCLQSDMYKLLLEKNKIKVKCLMTSG